MSPAERPPSTARAAGSPARSILSVNVAMPEPLRGREGRVVVTGIGKRPVTGRVRVHRLGLEGDGHGNTVGHGGLVKTVYAYPYEHYAFWRVERPEFPLTPGVFGENLTIQGLGESEVRPGDRLSIGTVRLRVTRPRFPCATLAVRFDRPTFVAEFQAAGRSGYYMSVEQEGELGAGDPVLFEPLGPPGPTIAEMFQDPG